MTPEEKVLYELEQKIALLFMKIAELKVTEKERERFEKDKEEYLVKIHDYKHHKKALEEREKQWNSAHQ